MLLSNSEFVSNSNVPVSSAVETGGPRRPARIYARLFKRPVDLALTIALVLLTAPVLIPLLAMSLLLVALDGHSPIYRQARIGRNGRVYQMLKIRTMVTNAEVRLIEHLASDPEAKAEWDCHQKLRNDPRITPVGRFLRKTSLDELPQLWNVLRGDMSLIGPRPMMVDQAKLYPGRAYYDMRPGITGLWQVSDRNHSSFADRAWFDDSYRDRLTFGFDLKILARTVGVVLRGTGC
ncbi:sugar transferase [Pseudooceanicola onchidii]|uniref:sugar transferase n=1 Tax=Pseudooceanicola onchidii TaxID=2562279 RepID=UPI0010AB19A0|nr:sugar transferase [Pseudooceanicola onchidii]